MRYQKALFLSHIKLIMLYLLYMGLLNASLAFSFFTKLEIWKCILSLNVTTDLPSEMMREKN